MLKADRSSAQDALTGKAASRTAHIAESHNLREFSHMLIVCLKVGQNSIILPSSIVLVSSESLKKHEFAAKPLSLVDIRQKMVGWIKDQVPLWEAFWIATAIHVLLIPVLWIMGWVLPWPKPPVITTVVEIDLRNWPREAKPLSVEEIRLPEHNR